jgi:RNA polymerase sigma factor (sigma-70 family)
MPRVSEFLLMGRFHLTDNSAEAPRHSQPEQGLTVQTSASLLERLRLDGDAGSWQRGVDLYEPLIRGWLRRHNLQHSDLDDLVQDVLGVLVKEISHFQHNGRPGAFRSWLRTITVHCLRRFWRARLYRADAAGGSDWEEHLRQLEDPTSSLSKLWDDEHDRHVLRRLLAMIEPDFQATTWRAFRRVVLDGVPAATVAADLGLSVNALMLAKSRGLQRLRQAAQGLLD